MVVELQDTIVALSSAPGIGARAIVRLSGPAAVQIVLFIFSCAEQVEKRKRCVYTGMIRLPDIHSPLPADLHVWPEPRSYTGQDLVEIHTLSCPPLVDLLIAELLARGARAAQAGEFTMRAFLAGKLDLTRAEAVLAVIEANDRQDLNDALKQLAGGVARPLHKLRDDLLNLLADLEAGLDFTEEDIDFVEQEQLLGRVTQGLAQLALLRKQLAERSVDARTFRVVLAGKPNAGKSSLWNALTGGPTAIVSSEPGTTRDYLTCVLQFDGSSVELIDTAGWQSGEDAINTQAQALGSEQAGRADLVLLCMEAGREFEREESALLDRRPPPMVIPIATKCDLACPPAGHLPTSVVTGQGLSDLRELLATRARHHAHNPLAPSLSRCLHHVETCTAHLRQAHDMILHEEPSELLALELRGAIEALGEMVGVVYTEDLLDRIFSRFCIGK